MKAVKPNENELHTFLGYEQRDMIDEKILIEEVRKEVEGRLEQLTSTSLIVENLVNAINYKILLATRYVIYFYNLRRLDLEDLDKSWRPILKGSGSHGRQLSDALNRFIVK